MGPQIRSITVYCSSSDHVDRCYLEAARELGAAIARAGWRLVYGGNCVGCMRELADGARSAGGKVSGITPRLLVEQGIADQKCDELLVTSGMRERKALLEERGDAFIALPGGLGTMEEIFEIIVGRVLGFHAKPIVLLDIAGYYVPLLSMIAHGIEQGFIRPTAREAYFVAADVTQAIEYLKRMGRQPQSAQVVPSDDSSVLE